MPRPAFFCLAAVALSNVPAAHAGTFLFIKERSQRDPADDPSYVEPFSVVHSPAFSSSTGGNQLLVPICVAADHPNNPLVC